MVRKDQWPIVAVNVAYLLGAGFYFGARHNYEFLLYIGVIVLFFALIAFTNERVRYSNEILWGLTVWGVLHMLGGGVQLGDHVLYGQMLLPLSDRLPVLRFDQVVHMFGFGVATVLMHHLLRPVLKPDVRNGTALSIVVVMAGLGVGALNEIVEFIAVVLVPETGVGGYENTSLDLVSDLIGALLALAYLRFRETLGTKTD